MNSPAPPRSPRSSRSQFGGDRRVAASHRHQYQNHHQHLHQQRQQFSDCPPEPDDSLLDSPSLGKRSVSLTTLQPTAIIQPRMAQLETLEAKMASIEVSLSSSPRRKKNGSVGGASLNSSSVRSVPKELALKELENLRNALRDKENIIQNLKGQLGLPGLHITQHIRAANGLINNNIINSNNNRELSEVEKKQAEDRLTKLRIETDNKRLAIKNLKLALERLDITDNIDVRIQQAELEYQLGREELNLLTLLEETRTLQICLDESAKNNSESQTLHSCIKAAGRVVLRAVELAYDVKSPRFGASSRDAVCGLWIDWALEETALCKEDRLVEVNGKIVLNKTREDLARLLAAAPDPAVLVVLRRAEDEPQGAREPPPPALTSAEEVAALRCELGVVKEKAEETQKTKDGLISDNIRLTHRISYLEEQVAELLTRKTAEISSDVCKTPSSKVPPVLTSTVKTNQNVTNINISSAQPSSNNNNNALNDLQIFQKGPQVTAIVANLPGLDVSKESHTSLPIRSKSSLSNVSNTHIPAPNLPTTHQENNHHASCHKNHRHHHHKRQYQDQDPKTSHKLYYSETSGNESSSNRERDHHHHQKDYRRFSDYVSKTSVMDQSYRRASMIVQDLTKSTDNVYEKHRQKCLTASEKYTNGGNGSHLLKHYNSRKSASVIDFRSQQQESSTKISAPPSRHHQQQQQQQQHQQNHLFYGRVDARSVKSLDFDRHHHLQELQHHHQQSVLSDYASETNDCDKVPHYYLSQSNVSGDYVKPRPPKKPLRLSLHKTQSLQSVETPESSTTPSGSLDKNDSRKASKRNHKGQSAITTSSNGFFNGSHHDLHYKTGHKEYSKKNSINALSALKWTSFGSSSSKLIDN